MLGEVLSRQPAAFVGLVRGLVERRPAMGELLAALIFGVIIFGFTALMLIPLFFAWLLVAVYKEPSTARSWIVTEMPVSATEAAETEATPEERPKVMAAGRRRPLP
jgi:hypothetical protein